MTLRERIDAFVKLGLKIQTLLDNNNEDLNGILTKAYHQNSWFDEFHCRFALSQIVSMLRKNSIEDWLGVYSKDKIDRNQPKRVAVIMAGNIPLVGFHDFLSVLITAHVFIGKFSSQDKVLWQFVIDLLLNIESRFEELIFIKDDFKDGFDVVIATGGDNTSRYFEYYFGKYPHIIRKNRNSIAVLTGYETDGELMALVDDICLYYGRGCRSVSKLFVPEDFDFSRFFKHLQKYKHFADYHKYYNNYEYYKSIYIINNNVFFDTDFMLIKEQSGFSSPVGVLYYEYYEKIEDVNSIILNNKDILQCVLSAEKNVTAAQHFGSSQSPALNEYADSIDTISFLIEI